jgi:hypothetical protein
MEATRSSKTSIYNKPIWHNIAEDVILLNCFDVPINFSFAISNRIFQSSALLLTHLLSCLYARTLVLLSQTSQCKFHNFQLN